MGDTTFRSRQHSSRLLFFGVICSPIIRSLIVGAEIMALDLTPVDRVARSHPSQAIPVCHARRRAKSRDDEAPYQRETDAGLRRVGLQRASIPCSFLALSQL